MPVTFLREMRLWTLFTVLLTFASPVSSQTIRSSVVGTDIDFITSNDPSVFQQLTYQGSELAEMPDKRGEDLPLHQTAFVFAATFSDDTAITLFMDGDFQTVMAAQAEAERYVRPLGQLPTALRQGVDRLVVHHGGEQTTAFSDQGLIVVYAGNATLRLGTHDLEETIFHESVHAAWDAKYAKGEAWRRAQLADNRFVTVYARENPAVEDLAETALFAYTYLHHPERLPSELRDTLAQTIFHRMAFVGEIIPPGEPVMFSVKDQQRQPADSPE